jgi:hypothetical protein
MSAVRKRRLSFSKHPIIRILVIWVISALGLFFLVLNGFILWLAAQFVPGFEVDSIWTATLAAFGVTAVNVVLSTLLTIDDDGSYYRNVINKRIRRRKHVEETDVPAVFFLEIDGLAKPVLEKAMAQGYAPTLKRWLDSGSHSLIGWETDLSSQTSASQAGLLHGNNYNIPAFGWYDRERRKIVASSAPDEIAQIEKEHSDGNGLLVDDGASRGNMLSGDAPRPYHFVILSDHGQSSGATFKQRYGKSLAEFVQELTGEFQVGGFEEPGEGVGNLNNMLTDAIRNEKSATAKQAAGTVQRYVTEDDKIQNDQPQVLSADDVEGDDLPDVVVMASGNLGLIFSTRRDVRATQEEIETVYPGMLEGLVSHEGIGFVMVHSEEHGPVVIGANGIHYLEGQRVEGEDPLTAFGPRAAEHLIREDTFPNCPDILINSFYNAETNEVAAFEELIGCHGGVGGYQTPSIRQYCRRPTSRLLVPRPFTIL